MLSGMESSVYRERERRANDIGVRCRKWKMGRHFPGMASFILSGIAASRSEAAAEPHAACKNRQMKIGVYFWRASASASQPRRSFSDGMLER